jgi:hypothetical protein
MSKLVETWRDCGSSTNSMEMSSRLAGARWFHELQNAQGWSSPKQALPKNSKLICQVAPWGVLEDLPSWGVTKDNSSQQL